MITEDHIRHLIMGAVPPSTSPSDRIQDLQRRVRRRRLRWARVSTVAAVTLVAMTMGIFVVLKPGPTQCSAASNSAQNTLSPEKQLRRQMATLPLLAMIAVLGGCSSPAGAQVATAQRPSSSPSGPAPVTAHPTTTKGPYDELYEQGLKFTRCMNDHGIYIADPTIGQALEYGINQRLTKQKTYDAAIQACLQFAPSVWPVDPKLYDGPAQTAKLAPYRKCVREHGGYAPEPDANGMILEKTLVYPAGVETPEQSQAEQACYGLLDDPALKQGN